MPKRARKDLDKIQDRRAEVVRLRAQGRTWDQIARETGYASASSASKAWHAAIKQHPDQTVDAIRAQEKTRIEQMDSVMAGIIANPPIRATSIGRVMWDPRTCTCGVRGDTKRDHAEDCQVQPVLDAAAVIRASAERRQVGESLRRLTSADAPAARDAGFDEEHVRMLAEVLAAQRQRGPLPPLPALPPSYATMTPEQQARADLDRRRDQLAAVPLDIVEAEIVDD